MGYRLNRLDEPVFIAGSKPLLTEFGIHLSLESCDFVMQGHLKGQYATSVLEFVKSKQECKTDQ